VAATETRFFAANGIIQHVVLAGPAGARPVLLIHGLGWDQTLWGREIDWLAAGGWRVIAPDLRGMGLTDKPDVPYSIDLYVADMAALLDALAFEQVAVIGFSLGGMIALAMAARLGARIGAGLVACCSPASTAEGAAATEAMLAHALTSGPRRFAEEQAETIWSPDWARDHPIEVQRFVDWRAGMDQEALARAFRAAYGVDLRAELYRVAAPMRVVMAERDSFVSVEAGRALAEALSNADVVLIAGAGHMASLERPEEFRTALVEFLGRVWPPLPVSAGAPA
jgi:3-oxoadipate enol-lactonase